ncbi:hypothetical protein LTS18_010018, partial [Coniosporium uncinatum]
MVGSPDPWSQLESAFLQAEQQPRKHDPRHSLGIHDFFPSGRPVPVHTYTDDNTSIFSGHESGLPPTPPSRDQGDYNQHQPYSSPAFSDGVTVTSLLGKLSPPAPLAQSPPTPETTPPALLAVPRSHNLSQISKESFFTAREEQPDGRSPRPTNSSHLAISPRYDMMMRQSKLRNNLGHSRSHSLGSQASYFDNGAIDGNTDSTKPSTPTSLRAFSNPFDMSPRKLHRLQQDHSNSKRLSTSSQASTIVEAYIIDNAPRDLKQRTLRHKSKATELRRDTAGIDGTATVERKESEGLSDKTEEQRKSAEAGAKKSSRTRRLRHSGDMQDIREELERTKHKNRPAMERRISDGVRHISKAEAIEKTHERKEASTTKVLRHTRKVSPDEKRLKTWTQSTTDEVESPVLGLHRGEKDATERRPVNHDGIHRSSEHNEPGNPKQLNHKKNKLPERPISQDEPVPFPPVLKDSEVLTDEGYSYVGPETILNIMPDIATPRPKLFPLGSPYHSYDPSNRHVSNPVTSKDIARVHTKLGQATLRHKS